MLRNTEEQVPMLKEGEVQQSQGLLREESVAQDLGSPTGGSIPSYADMEKKQPMDKSVE